MGLCFCVLSLNAHSWLWSNLCVTTIADSVLQIAVGDGRLEGVSFAWGNDAASIATLISGTCDEIEYTTFWRSNFDVPSKKIYIVFDGALLSCGAHSRMRTMLWFGMPSSRLFQVAMVYGLLEGVCFTGRNGAACCSTFFSRACHIIQKSTFLTASNFYVTSKKVHIMDSDAWSFNFPCSSQRKQNEYCEQADVIHFFSVFTNQPGDIIFEDVHSHQIEKIRNVINSIEKIWNTTIAHGTLRRDF